MKNHTKIIANWVIHEFPPIPNEFKTEIIKKYPTVTSSDLSPAKICHGRIVHDPTLKFQPFEQIRTSFILSMDVSKKDGGIIKTVNSIYKLKGPGCFEIIK